MSKRGANSALRRDGFGPLLCLCTAIACLFAATDTRAAELEADAQPWPSFAEARLEIADMAAEGSVAAAVAAEGQPEPQPVAGFSFATAQIQIAIEDATAGAEAGILVAEAMREAQVPNAASPTGSEPMRLEASTTAGPAGTALSPIIQEKTSPTAVEVGTTAAGETARTKVDISGDTTATTATPAPQTTPLASKAAAAEPAATDAKTAEPAMSETVPASAPPEVAAPASQTAETPVTSTQASDETSRAATADIPGITAVPAKAERAINSPPPVPDYYAERAKSLLEDERATGTGFKVEGFPDHSIVVCVGGCIKNDVGIVYAEPKARVIKTGGEMIPTAARTDDAPADAAMPASAATIECVAGCYDSAPRRYRSPAAADMQRKIQAAAAAAVARTDGKLQDATPAPDDWETAAPLPQPEAKNKTPRSERRGNWFTRIERSRTPSQ